MFGFKKVAKGGSVSRDPAAIRAAKEIDNNLVLLSKSGAISRDPITIFTSESAKKQIEAISSIRNMNKQQETNLHAKS